MRVHFFKKNSLYVNFLLLVTVLAQISCSPKIKAFSVDSMAIGVHDSVMVHWNIQGVPTLIIDEKISKRGDQDSSKLWELTLVVTKGKKSIKRLIQVEVIKDQATDTLSFFTERENDSTLIARGTKSIERWNHFQIQSLSSASGRMLTVTHAGKIIILDSSGHPSVALNSLPYSGSWEIRTRLTPQERMGTTALPEMLQIKAIIQAQ